uniref:glycosyl hydrolase n=1 Tax=Pseudonocardia pini TaxID=2758030 RepID=UPI001C693E25
QVAGDTVRTTLAYRTSGGDTLVAAMPESGAAACASVGGFDTLYGRMDLCRTTSIELSAPVVAPSGALDVSGLAAGERRELEQAVTADTAALELTAQDTYFGGKQLARAANLLTLAEGLDMGPTAERIRDQLVPLLERWAEPAGCTTRATQCFVYDPTLRGMVGLENSFGSEEFNDHQFHYGYFLYAAGVLGKDDPELVARVAPVIDLLAADIGSVRQTSEFPRHRAFDAFEGHSWASGFSPFGDGNNQESSSESVTAYNGLALWAQVRGQADLQEQAVAMLSREAASALRYWTQPQLAGFRGFGSEILSINWGGKRDYATWFSAEPSAMLGIQLIPMSPVAGYLRGDPGRIRSSVAEAAPAGFDVTFGDYLLMYLALADKDEALAQARDLPDSRIDDGNTRAYMLAWILTR